MTLFYDSANKTWKLSPYELEKTDLPTTKTLYLISSFTSYGDGRGGGTTSYSLSETPPITPAPYRDRYGTIYPPAPTYTILKLTPSGSSNLGLSGIGFIPANITETIAATVKTLQLNEEDNNKAIITNKKLVAKNQFEAQAKTSIDNLKKVVNIQSIAPVSKYVTVQNEIKNLKYLLTNGGHTSEEADKEINNLIAPYSGSLDQYYRSDPSIKPSVYSATDQDKLLLSNREGALSANQTFDRFNKYRNGTSGYFFDKTDLGKQAAKEWDDALNSNDLDILLRYDYSKEQYGLSKYLQALKGDPNNINIRGSEIAPLKSQEYKEPIRTDANNAEIRDNIFGLRSTTDETGALTYELKNTGTGEELASFVKSNKTASNLFAQARKEAGLLELGNISGPWTKLVNDVSSTKGVKTDLKTVTSSEAAFASFLGLAATLDPQQNSQVISNNKTLYDSINGLNSDSTFTELTSSAPEITNVFKQVISQSDVVQKQQFDLLRRQALTDTIAALKEAKQKEGKIAYFQPLIKDLQSVQDEFNASINSAVLSDSGLGNVNPIGGQQANTQQKYKLDFGINNIFNTKNGLIYNWQDWINNEIEKKYAGGIDIPNDYVPLNLRTEANGFIDKTGWSTEKKAAWDKADKAYLTLKTNPNDFTSKNVIKNLPEGYVPVESRKVVQDSWKKYEDQLKANGYVDPETVASWKQYDDAWRNWQDQLEGSSAKAAALEAYNKLQKPEGYIPPDKRMGQEVQFARDFYTQYLKPRFDASQSIAEFQDYIDVTDKTQNPFQTQDKVNALKMAAQNDITRWYANLQKLNNTEQGFNAEYYTDPNTYLQQYGLVGKDAKGGEIGLLAPDAFDGFVDTVAGFNNSVQAKRVADDWEAAKAGRITKDDQGNAINWAAKAYEYGIDITNPNEFANLHYQMVGLRAAKKDKDGNIVYQQDDKGNYILDSQGNKMPELLSYDGSPAMLAPSIANLYISKVLTPLLIKEADKIGTVFGQFIKPEEYVNNLVKAVGLVQGTPEWQKLLKDHGLDPNSSLTDLKNELASALAQDSTANIKNTIGGLIDQQAEINQLTAGVEYIQKETPPTGTTTQPSGVYAVFKNAGFTGTEQQFYDQFMPGASKEDINIINAAYTPGGIKDLTGIDTTASATDQFTNISSLFGDTSFSEISSLTGKGTTTTAPKTSLLSFDETGTEDSFSFKDPFATSSGKEEMGIGDPFDEVGIGDPFAETNDPFLESSNPFGTIKASTSSKISSIGNFFPSLSSSSKSNSFADFSSWTSF